MQRFPVGALVIAAALALRPSSARALDETWQRPGMENPVHTLLGRLFGDGQFGKSYALVVGIGDYDAVKKLDAPKNDAMRVRDFLRNEAEFDYIVTLTDADATRERIERLMDTEFPARVKANDRFFFYFSGHGATRILGRTSPSRGYLVLKASKPDHWEQMIAMPRMREWADNLGSARHVLFVLDACFSGLVAFQVKDLDARKMTLQRLAQPSSYILTAGVDQEESFAFNGASLFTQAFLATARGQLNPPPDGIVSLDDLIAGIHRSIDARRMELGSNIKMTPQLYKERIENNEGEFFFIVPVSAPTAIGLAKATGGPQVKSLDPGFNLPTAKGPADINASESILDGGTAATHGTVNAGVDSQGTSRFLVGGAPEAQTVLDRHSRLMWTRKDFWNIEGRYPTNWDEAVSWVKKMNAEHYAGFDDWSLPSIAQYRTINTSRADRAAYAQTFEKTASANFWSSNNPSPILASYINFAGADAGFAVSGAKAISSNSVRLVRKTQ